LIFW